MFDMTGWRLVLGIPSFCSWHRGAKFTAELGRKHECRFKEGFHKETWRQRDEIKSPSLLLTKDGLSAWSAQKMKTRSLVYFGGVARKLANMAQVGRHPLVVRIGIGEIEMLCDARRQETEEAPYSQEGVPRSVARGVRVSRHEHIPQMRLKLLLQMLSQVTGALRKAGAHADIPGEHFHQLGPHEF